MQTLQDVAENCYQRWLTTDQAQLPKGIVEWLRNDLGEKKISEDVSRIFVVHILGSEKCYRFLKLTGVIDRDRLRQLLKKQVLVEIESERTLRLKGIDSQFRGSVNEQRRLLLRSPHDGSFPTWLLVILTALVTGILGRLVYSSIGWSLGVLAGASLACGVRMMRISNLIEQFIRASQSGLEEQRKSVENDINDKRVHIDEEIIELERLYAGPLVDTVQRKTDPATIISAPDTMRYLMVPSAVTLALAMLPVFVSESTIKGFRETGYTMSSQNLHVASDKEATVILLHEIGDLIDNKKYSEASDKLKAFDHKYPDPQLTDMSMVDLRALAHYRAVVDQNIDGREMQLNENTFTIEGVITNKTEMQGSGAFWYFTLIDAQGQKYDFFQCSSVQPLYFMVAAKAVEYMDGYNQLMSKYSRAKVYINLADREYFNKCLVKGCDGGICPRAIVMFTRE